jgi:type I restriction enzyme S subunit
VRLDEVCEFLDSRRIPVNNTERAKRIAGKSLSALYPYYGANGQTGWIDDYIFDEPLILLAEDGGNFGSRDKPIAYSVDGRYWVNNHAHVLRPKENIIDFSFCLHALSIRPDVAEMVSGSTRAKLNQEIAAKIPIPLPPRNEQNRIAAILNEQMTTVERARVAAEAQLKAAKDLPTAYLRKVFDSSGGNKWQRKTIAQMMSSGILLYHQDGNHGGLHPRNKDFVATGVKFVTAKHINGDGTLALDRAPCISQEQASGLRIGFGKSQDVLLAHNATVGPVGIAASECEPFIVGTSLTIFRCNVEHLLPSYLFVALRAVSFQRQLFDAMKQTTRNQVPITRQREMTIPIPTLSEQEKIANELTAQLQITERATEKLEEQLTSINNLPLAFLHEAFTGKL